MATNKLLKDYRITDPIEFPIDDAIDENSENPVQNKVIAAALKTAGKVKTVNRIEPDDAGDIILPVDSEIDGTSENPVQNKVISEEVVRIDEYALRNRRSISDIQDALDYLGVFIIRVPADLIRLQDKWNNKEVSTAFALQVANIDMSSYDDWVGIGTSDHPFVGQYNGNYYNITGLRPKVQVPVSETSTEIKKTNNYMGLINYAKDTVIKNINNMTIDGFKFADEIKFDTTYKTLAELEKALPTGTQNIVYRLDLDNEANGKKMYWTWDPFTNSYVEFEFGAAGILGKAVGSVTIDNVKVYGEIGSAEYPCSHNCAGIVIARPSVSDHGNLTITNSENHANLYSAYTKAGGILAFQEDPTAVVTIENCTNAGNVKGYVGNVSDEGGIAGILGCNSVMSNPPLIMRNVRNTGLIESNFRTQDYSYHSVAQIVPKPGSNGSEYTTIHGIHMIDDKLNAPLFGTTINIRKIAYLTDNELELIEGIKISYDGKTVTSSADLSVITKDVEFDFFDLYNPVYVDLSYGQNIKPNNVSPKEYNLERTIISPTLIEYRMVKI